MGQDINSKTTLHFDEEFLKEEVRCDYTVTSKTKKIWAIQMDLLNQMIEVCNKLNIQVYIYAGTLLGAVRHQGFIPWDDDIDVCMKRDDFNKLLKFGPKEFKHPYFLQTGVTDQRFYLDYARLRNSDTTGIIVSQKATDYNNGIYIDVFVLDGYSEDANQVTKLISRRNKLKYLVNAYQMNDLDENNKAKNLLKSLLHYTFCKIVPLKIVMGWVGKNLSTYNNTTNRLSLMTHPERLYSRYWCTKEELSEVVYLPFEGMKVPAPAKYKDILSHMYGNYMEFPPVEKRGTWHEGVFEFDPEISYVEYIKIRQ